VSTFGSAVCGRKPNVYFIWGMDGAKVHYKHRLIILPLDCRNIIIEQFQNHNIKLKMTSIEGSDNGLSRPAL
jgi:hypothetical protein